jgi:hypothetical protein
MANQKRLTPAISLAQLRESDTSFLDDTDRIELIEHVGEDGTRPRAVSLAFSEDGERPSSMGKDSDFRHVSMAYSDADRHSSLDPIQDSNQHSSLDPIQDSNQHSSLDPTQDSNRHSSLDPIRNSSHERSRTPSPGYYEKGSTRSRNFSSSSLSPSNVDTRKSSVGSESHNLRHTSNVSMHSTHHLIAEVGSGQRAINHVDRLWTPRSLQIPSLIGISFLFLVFIIAMEILALYSRRNHGFPVPSIPPLWTYIPVALVFIQAAVWAQMEYRIKSLTPWRVLARGPSTASDTLFLDYLSPWNIITLVSSLASRHYAVSLAVLGSFLLKLLIIAATGLLTPESSAVGRPTSVELLTGFGRGTINLNAITANDALMGIANMRGQFQEPGINGSWAYQTMKPFDPSLGK